MNEFVFKLIIALGLTIGVLSIGITLYLLIYFIRLFV